MPRKATAPTRNKEQPAVPEDDVDKIRDIIFGGQMREYARRFDDLEQKVLGAVDRLAKDTDKRFGDLERSIVAQIQKVADKLATEREQRKTDHSATKSQVKEVEKLIGAKISDSDNRLAAELDEIHATLEEESKSLTAAIEKVRGEMTRIVSGEAQRLEKNKLDAKDLAQLLNEMARRLKEK